MVCFSLASVVYVALKCQRRIFQGLAPLSWALCVELDLVASPYGGGVVVALREYYVESCTGPTYWREYENWVSQIKNASMPMHNQAGGWWYINIWSNRTKLTRKIKKYFRQWEKTYTWDGVDLGSRSQRHVIATTKNISSERMAVSHKTRFLQLCFSILFSLAFIVEKPELTIGKLWWSAWRCVPDIKEQKEAGS